MITFSENSRNKQVPKGEKGAITVFLSITLLLMITLTGLLVDGARIRTSETMVKRVTANALHSSLSYYDKTFKEDYGLFTLALPDELLGDYLRDYVEVGLKQRDSQTNSREFWDIYSFMIEEIEGSSLYPLAEDEVIRQQILEFMKYRGPKKLAEEFIDKLVEVSKISEAATIMKEKIQLERQLSELAHLEKQLEENIAKVNQFNLLEVYPIESTIGGRTSALVIHQNQKEDLSNELHQLTKDLEKVTLEEKVYLQLQMEELQQKIREENENIEGSQSQLINEINQLMKKIENQMLYNVEINQLAKLIQAKNEEVKKKTEVLKQKSYNPQEGIGNDIAKTLLTDLEDYGKTAEEYDFNNLIKLSSNNILILKENITPTLTQMKSIIQQQGRSGLEGQINRFNGLIGTYHTNVMQYNYKFAYNRWKLELEDLGEATEADTRRETAKKANDFLKEDEGNQLIISQSLQNLLPSKGIGKGNSTTLVEFDSNGKKSGYSEESFSLLEGLLGNILSVGEGIRDELYINEYILGIFKSNVSEHNPFQNNLRNQPKSSRVAFFDSEVEYILYGNSSQRENITAVKKDLMKIRFFANLLYVYSDVKLVKNATILATKLSAPIGMAAMPLIKTLILCGWSMNYSIEDTKQLLKGETVNFYRNKETLKFHYEDYLRILLLRPGFTSTVKLNRIKDLIQLNLQKNPMYGAQFTLEEANTFVKMDITYSIKVLFFRQVKKSEGIKLNTSDKVYYKMELLQGY